MHQFKTYEMNQFIDNTINYIQPNKYLTKGPMSSVVPTLNVSKAYLAKL